MSLVKSFTADPIFRKTTLVLSAEILLLGCLAYFHSASIPQEIRTHALFRFQKAGHLQKISFQQPYPLRFEIKYRTEGKVPANSEFLIRVNDYIQTFPIESSKKLKKVWIEIPQSATRVGENNFSYHLLNQPEIFRLGRIRCTNYYYLLTPKFPLALVLYDEQLEENRGEGALFDKGIEFVKTLVWIGFFVFLVFVVIAFCFKNNQLSAIIWVRNYCVIAILIFFSATVFSVFTPYHIAFSVDTWKWILCILPLFVYTIGALYSSRSTGLYGTEIFLGAGSSQPSGLETIFKGRYWLLLLIWGILTVPLSFEKPCMGGDCSYAAGMFMASSSGYQHGKDIVFTYGPTLVYLFKDAYFFNWNYWVANNLGLLFAHFIFVGSIACFILNSRASLDRYLFLIVVASMEEFLISQKLVLAGGILWFCVVINKIRHPWRLPAIALSTAALAFATFSKLTMGVASLSFILIFLLIPIFKQNKGLLKEGLIGALFYIFFIMLFWLATGQELNFFVDFIKNSFEIIRGYSEARASPGSQSRLVLCLLGLVGAIVVFANAIRLRDEKIFLFSLVFSGYLVVLFKSVLTVSKYPGEYTSAFLILAGLYFVLAGEKKDNNGREVLWIQKGLTTVALIFIFWMGKNGFFPHTIVTSWQPLNVLVNSIHDSSRQKQIEEEMKARLRRIHNIENPLLELVGDKTVDIFPWEISLAYAYDLKWKPRPVIQSYTAHTPYLDKLNSDFFKKTPPEMVLYDFQTLDYIYPIFYEPKTLVTLMQNYSLRVRSGKYLLLERNERRVSTYKRKLLKRVQARWGEPVAIPEYIEGYVFAIIDIDLSMYGKIIKLLSRPSRMYINIFVSGSEGKVQNFKHRFVRSLGTEGLLVSDYVAGLDQLEKLFQGKQRPDVKEIMLVPEISSHFDPQIDIVFYGVPKNEIILNEEAGSGS